jgi:hypothetical protein
LSRPESDLRENAFKIFDILSLVDDPFMIEHFSRIVAKRLLGDGWNFRQLSVKWSRLAVLNVVSSKAPFSKAPFDGFFALIPQAAEYMTLLENKRSDYVNKDTLSGFMLKLGNA